MQIKHSVSCTVEFLSISPIKKKCFHSKCVVFSYKGPNVHLWTSKKDAFFNTVEERGVT